MSHHHPAAVVVRRFLAAVVLFAAAMTAGDATAQSTGAVAFVQKVGDTAIKELTAPGTTDSARVSRMRQLLVNVFDKDAVSRFVLGPYARRASEAELKEFSNLYEIYVAHNYAGLFKRYNGQKVEMQREQAVADGSIDVYGVIRQPEGPPINMEMRVRKADSSFKAVDLKVEGVSMPLTHRKQFASVITQRGNKVSGLIDALRGAVERFEKETPSH